MNSNSGNGAKPMAGSDSELLTPKEAAGFLRMSGSFLAKGRMRGDGPRYRKLSRAVRYSKSDLLVWLKACTKTSTSEGHLDRPRKPQSVGPDKDAKSSASKNEQE
jgi:predicted DNA-binding transcriptional regulator AlpA